MSRYFSEVNEFSDWILANLIRTKSKPNHQQQQWNLSQVRCHQQQRKQRRKDRNCRAPPGRGMRKHGGDARRHFLASSTRYWSKFIHIPESPRMQWALWIVSPTIYSRNWHRKRRVLPNTINAQQLRVVKYRRRLDSYFRANWPSMLSARERRRSPSIPPLNNEGWEQTILYIFKKLTVLFPNLLFEHL